MTQEEFHRLYEQMPQGLKAELIGGVVYVSSPLRLTHGEYHVPFSTLLGIYTGRTPGVRPSDNTIIVIGGKGEVQPDLLLRVLPEFGGQSKTVNDYLHGAPEFIIEIAHSSRAIDLHAKKESYARYGVREYLVACIDEKQFPWFDLAEGKELQPDTAGIYRIGVFPGLWINGPALLTQDYQALMTTLEAGLATPEHAAFVKQLAERREERERANP